jgi:antitoxin MazE
MYRHYRYTENDVRVTVKKWGNSASIRIPSAILEAAQLAIDSTVDIREEKGRIIIERLRGPAYDLEQLLADVTPDNLHDEIDFGAPVGKEAF